MPRSTLLEFTISRNRDKRVHVTYSNTKSSIRCFGLLSPRSIRLMERLHFPELLLQHTRTQACRSERTSRVQQIQTYTSQVRLIDQARCTALYNRNRYHRQTWRTQSRTPASVLPGGPAPRTRLRKRGKVPACISRSTDVDSSNVCDGSRIADLQPSLLAGKDDPDHSFCVGNGYLPGRTLPDLCI
jgi:hypothetical protein